MTIQADVESDDARVKRVFDAEPWFEQATSEEIEQLWRCDWGGDLPADNVAGYVADQGNKELEDFFTYLNVVEIGFECHIDEDQAKAWLARKGKSMTGHTPEPWTLEREAIPGSNSHQWRIATEAGTVAVSPTGPQAFNEANARLIAAAPELVAALEALLPIAEDHERRLRVGDGDDSTLLPEYPLNAARAAIAKAKGG